MKEALSGVAEAHSRVQSASSALEPMRTWPQRPTRTLDALVRLHKPHPVHLRVTLFQDNLRRGADGERARAAQLSHSSQRPVSPHTRRQGRGWRRPLTLFRPGVRCVPAAETSGPLYSPTSGTLLWSSHCESTVFITASPDWTCVTVIFAAKLPSGACGKMRSVGLRRPQPAACLSRTEVKDCNKLRTLPSSAMSPPSKLLVPLMRAVT